MAAENMTPEFKLSSAENSGRRNYSPENVISFSDPVNPKAATKKNYSVRK